MTLLADPPLLVAGSALLERLVPDRRVRRGLQAAFTTAVLGSGIAMYVDAPWTRPLRPLLRISSGRDWMVNSWVLHLDHRAAPRAYDAAAVAAFAAYPLWTRLGQRLGRRGVSRRRSG